MEEISIGLAYVEEFDGPHVEEFLNEVKEAGLQPVVEVRENSPYAALEWVVPTAIAIYFGKPFIDVFLKRAADDLADAVYPAIKKSLKKLVKRLFFEAPVAVTVFTTSEKKVSDPSSLVFSVYSVTKTQHRMKFIFNNEMTVTDCEAYVEELFELLAYHHGTEDEMDSLSQQIANSNIPKHREVYLKFDQTTATWAVIDPIRFVLEQHRLESEAKANELDVAG